MIKELYRYDDLYNIKQVPAFPKSGESTLTEINLYVFPVIRHTQKGAWINVNGSKKWVSYETAKRFAYPTRAEAWIGFGYRKRAQLRIVTKKFNRINSVISLMNNGADGIKEVREKSLQR